MIEVTRNITVPAPPGDVWPLVDDPTRLPEWFTFAESAELLGGDGVGRRQRIHGHWGNKQSEVDQVVVEHDPPRRLAWKHEAERLDGKPAPRFAAETVFTIELEPLDDATTVTLTSLQVPASALKALAIRLFGRREVASNMERSLQRLADLVRA